MNDMDDMDDMDDFFMDESGYWQAPDFILTDIITTMVNMMEMPIGITIFMKGMILSGSLVSERHYLGSLSAVFQALASASFEEDETGEMDGDDNILNGNDDDISDEAEADVIDFDALYKMKKASVVPVRFLHLRDAMVLYPGASIGFRHSILPIVRIRIQSVDGWILGQALDASEVDGDDTPRPMVH